MEFSTARQRFFNEVRQPDEQIDLEKAALYIAQEANPNLEVNQYLNTLDAIAATIREQLPENLYPLRLVQAINHHLYTDLNFSGNQIDYYDPRNSFLNEVIDRRTGIPITLSLVYLAIAKRLNFPMVGIGMPGHFLIRPEVEEMELFVDPFHQGEVLFMQDCQHRLNQMYGQPVEMQPTFLEAVTNRQFLARILTNLKHIYLNRREINACLSTIERILILFPEAPFELRDRGVIYFRTDRWIEARQDLEAYLAIMPAADDRAIVQNLLTRIESFS
ncbi:SirB1 family protein [Myxacorys almedinensis]|uniref:Tetratricopeptide repeat protein n=1 Tax=Myxacorys almedinensis A TaxID=2690445 RepID=A0A8J7Z0T1_9CYAN|nr:transglutaminase-like domain-containing protein [Myxacorys almedinensis]NDJ16028.1 tetratricopeptide repeat protein [Myxacorys almedinensis A]